MHTSIHLAAHDFNRVPTFSRQNIADPNLVFTTIPNHLLVLEKPQTGCNHRAKIITDWLHASGFNTGRLWSLPIPPQEKICAYIDGVQMRWDYHVAATSETTEGWIVFDPVLFNAPVLVEEWKKTLSLTTPVVLDFWHQTRNHAPIPNPFKHLVYEDLQDEYQPSERELAMGGLLALSQQPQNLYTYRPMSPRKRITSSLLLRR